MFNTKLGLERAVLEGRKTVTRRICKYQPTDLNSKWHWVTGGDGGFLRRSVHPTSPRYRPPYDFGEIVAIKQCYDKILNPELYHELLQHYNTQFIEDVAGYKNKMFVACKFMPHKIKILNIRVERLQDISEEDCLKEGIEKHRTHTIGDKEYFRYWHPDSGQLNYIPTFPTAKEAFASLIDKVGKKGDWERNPFVWRIEYELIKE